MLTVDDGHHIGAETVLDAVDVSIAEQGEKLLDVVQVHSLTLTMMEVVRLRSPPDLR